MADPIVHGPGYSTFVRTVRLALEEKGVSYEHNDFDFMQGMPAEQQARHPFGKVPAFEHDGVPLYETCAIVRYVDEAFSGPALQPDSPQGRARMVQIMGICDGYTYGPTVGQVVIQRLVTPIMGGTPDEEAIEAAMPGVRKAMGALDGLLADQPYLAGQALSLADLQLAPIFGYFTMTPEGGPVLEATPNLVRWWDVMKDRPSMTSTQPKLG